MYLNTNIYTSLNFICFTDSKINLLKVKFYKVCTIIIIKLFIIKIDKHYEFKLI
jgi:hypothetical protein